MRCVSTHAQSIKKCHKSHAQIKLFTRCFYYIITCAWSRCVCSHVTIKQTAVCWLLNWSYIHKHFDSHISSLFQNTCYIHKHFDSHIEAFFKTDLCKEWIKKFIALLTKRKEKSAMNKWENDASDILLALYSECKKVGATLIPYLFVNFWKQKDISSVKSNMCLKNFMSWL